MTIQDDNKRGKFLPSGTTGSSRFNSSPSAGSEAGATEGSNYCKNKVGSKDRETLRKDCEVTEPGRPRRCGRSPDLVTSLTRIKEQQAKEMAKDARHEVWRTKRILKNIMDRSQYQELIIKVAAARNRVWKRSQTKHNKKIKFLIDKHNNCCDEHERYNNKTKSNKHNSAPHKTKEQHEQDPLITGTTFKDKELNEIFGSSASSTIYNEKDVSVYGQVTLDDDERSLLQKRPEFATFDKVQKTRLEEEFNTTMTKIRWDRRTRDWTAEDQDNDKNTTPEELEQLQEQEEMNRLHEAEDRLVYDKDKNTVDLGARRATDMGHNQRLFLPNPRPPQEEAILSARMGVWREVSSEYIAKECGKDGQQNVNNLTPQEQIGMNKLCKRAKAGEIIILQADKGNKFVVSSQESYERQGDTHTKMDRKIEKNEHEQVQSRMNCVSRGLAKIFRVGDNWGDRNAQRCWNNLVTESAIVPLMYPSPKVHKEPDEKGDPRSRPVVQANTCITSRPGEILADILDAAIQSFPDSLECQSTEEMLAEIDKVNPTIENEGKNVCIGSGDAVSLYPSLQHEASAKLCAEIIMSCPAVFSNIDTQAAVAFVSTNSTEKEIKEAGLSGIIPSRKYKIGRKPGKTTPEINFRNNKEGSKFQDVRKLNDREHRLLVARVVEIGVLQVVRNHLYSWKDEVWMQKLGVPTGLRLSGIIGRITMDAWMRDMRRLLEDNNMKTYLMEKYVDDCNTILENIPLGSRWEENKVTISEARAEEDRTAKVTNEEVTMKCWADMASTIIPGLRFTCDYPANNVSGRVPMLDFCLWKESVQDENDPMRMKESIRYTFYEKDVSNPRVLDRQTAMPHKMLIATLTQEGVRRLMNMSEGLPTEEKTKVLTKFMKKLLDSGYSQALRYEILKAAVQTYRKKQKAESWGIRPIHRPRGYNKDSRIREKMMTKTSWYRHNPRSWKSKLKTMEKEKSAHEVTEEGGNRDTPAGSQGQDHHTRDDKHIRTKDKNDGPGNTKPKSPANSHIEGVMFVPHTPGGPWPKSYRRKMTNLHPCTRSQELK